VEFETDRPDVVKLRRTHLPKSAPPDTPLVTESPISLQNHSSEAWFRNLKIRERP
jgi:hypothetical protein